MNVVKINNPNLTACGFGSGFFVDNNVILTCNHCLIKLEVGDKVEIEIHDQPETATVIALDEKSDLALLKSESITHDIAQFTKSYKRREEVFVIGFNKYVKSTLDQIGVIQDPGENKDFIIFNGTKIIDGYSGSPLITERNGLVIGIVNQSLNKNSPEGGKAVSHAVIAEFCKKQNVIISYLPTEIEDSNQSLKNTLEPILKDKCLFNRKLKNDRGKIISFDQFINDNSEGMNIIYGIGGLGKSFFLKRICLNLMKLTPNSFSVYCNAKNWNEEYSDGIEISVPVETRIDNLLSGFGKQFTREEFSRLRIGKGTNEIIGYFFLDGLNELADSELRSNVIKCLRELNLRFGFKIYITSRYLLKEYKGINTLEIQKIDDETLDQILSENFGKKKENYTDKKNYEYLSLPFFLNIAIESKNDIINTYSEFIYTHTLKNIASDNREQVTKLLSEIAYTTYCSKQKFLIPIELTSDLPPTLNIVENVLRKKDDGFEFEHQLNHEFFVAHKIASMDPSNWNESTFDAISLNNKVSYEIMQMILEQIETSEQGELFLQALYDWSFNATLHDLAYVDKKYSKEFALALLLILSFKLFDPFLHTRTKILKYFDLYRKFGIKGLPENLDVHKIMELNNKEAEGILNNVINENRSSFLNGKFEQWYEIFSQPAHYEDEQLADHLLSDNSLIGWGAANVIRRFNYNSSIELQLRTQLRTTTDRIKKWRIVHALGNSTEKKSINLLFTILNKDSYELVVYGAVRSLVEIALFKVNGEVTREILNRLMDVFKETEFEDFIINEFRSCLTTRTCNQKAIIVNEVFQLVISEPKFQQKDEWTNAHQQFRRVNNI